MNPINQLFNNGLFGIIAIASVVLVLLAIFLRFVPVGLWVTAYFSGVKVGIGTLIGMRLRRVARPDSGPSIIFPW